MSILKIPSRTWACKIVREAAIAANNDAGDGTTTATILSDAIVSEGVRCVISGSDPLALRRGIQRAADAVAQEVLKDAVEVSTREQIAEIATVSAGDRVIGAKDRRGHGRYRQRRHHLCGEVPRTSASR